MNYLIDYIGTLESRDCEESKLLLDLDLLSNVESGDANLFRWNGRFEVAAVASTTGEDSEDVDLGAEPEVTWTIDWSAV